MSKDGGVKVTPGCKHKERKPKKPHYIPRPWGKPYNYKCFQCPFTCMEKSHLYNHMKYSLCKNSLSLLIESDWPYKKGGAPRAPPPPPPHRHALGLIPPLGAAGEEPLPEEQRGKGRAEVKVDEEAEEKGSTEGSEESSSSLSSGRAREPPPAAAAAARGTKHRSPRPPLELEAEPERPPEEQLKQCVLPGPLLAEQWRLLAKHRADGSLPCCPPPPPPPPDYQDPSALGLSLLGVGYPLGPLGPLGPAGIFSYVGAAAARGHAQLGQLPLLPPPPPTVVPPSVPPRLYYPFLCEHALGGSAGVAKATGGVGGAGEEEEEEEEEAGRTRCPVTLGLWKVPALRPPQTSSAGGGWGPQEGLDRLQAGWDLKRKTGAPHPPAAPEGPAGKRPAAETAGFTLDLLKSLQNASPLAMATEKMLLHTSVRGPQPPPSSRPLEGPAPPLPPTPGPVGALLGRVSRALQGPAPPLPPTPGPVGALLGRVSRALQEYCEVERLASRPGRGGDGEPARARARLWEHLGRVRSELSHLQEALEGAARPPPEGPLDLSVKRGEGAGGTVVAWGDRREMAEEEEEEEEEEGTMEEEGEKEDQEEEEEEEDAEERERKALKASLESRKQSLDLLIRMSQAGGAPGGGGGTGGTRPGSVEPLWPGRTTKCEADSSVLLGPDGRPAALCDLPSPPPSAKVPKRPPSLQCTPSPLGPAD